MSREFDELVQIMGKLRSEEGCPWDKKQTITSLRKYLLEETYEVAEAIDKKDYSHLKEELGDLLLQIVFQSQIATERGEFTVNDVAKGISEKLIKRHPHIWGDTKVKDADEVVSNWQKIKAEEKIDRKYILDGVPSVLPSLIYAEKIQKKASEVGFDWVEVKDVIEKIEEELTELKEAIEKNEKENIDEEIGDLLFSVVNVSRFVKVDSEHSLKKCVDKFKKRFKYIEDKANKMNIKIQDMTFKQMDEIWDEAKEKLNG